MCGICGGLNLGNRTPVKAMCQTMVHRGPDDEGLCCDGDVILGMRRLSIIDLSQAGHQPMSNEDGTVWIVYNGETYNFQTKRAELEQLGHHFRSQTDTEVVLHLYEEYGTDCVHHLRGMFAFAIWDSQRGRLLLARDRLGIKPLYYHYDGKRFVFASELGALIASGLVSAEIDPGSVVAFLMLGSIPGPDTIYQGIRALPPGHWALLEDGCLKIERYWDTNFSFRSDWREEDILPRLQSLLTESVSMRLVSDVPLGAFLSGGIDSSAVVALMRRATSGVIRTFSVYFPEFGDGERLLARQVATKFATEHHECAVTGQDLDSQLDAIIQAMDQPTVNGVNTYFVSKFARESGVTVALSGLGGDELFAGYPSFQQVPPLYRWLATADQIPGGRKLLAAILHAGNRYSRAEKLAACIDRQASLEAIYLSMRGLYLGRALDSLLAPDIRQAAPAEDYMVERLQALSTQPSSDPLNRISQLELRSYMHNQLLRDTDVMSMSHSLEVRVPLIDHLVVEYVASLPSALKMDGKTPKKLLTKALGEDLPHNVVYRPKATFTFPFAEWMKGYMKERLESILFSADEIRIFDKTGVCAAWRSFLGGKLHWSRIWAIVTLKMWMSHSRARVQW